jgi:hypothetical protein
MAVAGRQFFFVLYLDPVAIATVGCRAGNDTVGCRMNGRSEFGGEVDTLVHDERSAPGDRAGCSARRSRCAT